MEKVLVLCFSRVFLSYECSFFSNNASLFLHFTLLYKKLLKPMIWHEVSNWVMFGGSFLGTQKQLPEKIMDKVAAAFEKYGFHGILLVGGFEASVY